MASIEFDEASGRYRIWFRYAGKPYKRSLKTTEKREAEAVVGRVEETIRLLERGRLDIPSDADPGVFILSDGKLNWKLTAEQEYTLEKLLDLYPKSLPEGAKSADHPQDGRNPHFPPVAAPKNVPPRPDREHRRHASLHRPPAARQIPRKADRPGHGEEGSGHAPPDLELGCSAGLFDRPGTDQGLTVSKGRGEAPLYDTGQIEKIIKRGGLTEKQQGALWECLILRARRCRRYWTM